jgi:hypothetical protein
MHRIDQHRPDGKDEGEQDEQEQRHHRPTAFSFRRRSARCSLTFSGTPSAVRGIWSRVTLVIAAGFR